ncbi:hypothetical protein HN587_01440 [Candidatus Woesearchaeota archaeon]|jgi:Na+/melibiose symporter-like transporter|nr:hypothetical protein [Candidatus Woesearchaeota archaeon]
MKKRLDIHEGIFLAIVLFSSIAVFIPGTGYAQLMVSLLSVSSFLFGLFIAFSISDRHARLKELREQMNAGDALVVIIDKFSSVWNTKIHKKIKSLIDDWLISTMDYKLEDYSKTQPKFLKLIDYIVKLKLKSTKKEENYEKILDILKELNIQNKKIVYLTKDKMSSFEWGSIIILGTIILFCLFIINNNTPASIVLVVLLATTLVLLMLILRDLDQLIWKENEWNWESWMNVFSELNLIPYFPEEFIKNKRIILPKCTTYRSVKYPHKYPNIQNKIVTIKISK